MSGTYNTAEGYSNAEIVIKGSRFISYLEHCSSEEEAQNILARVRYEHADATHNCFAYICGDTERFSDDGEPSGTAGRPILYAMRGSGLKDIIVIVTRYFGGTLLGTGGLVQAYTEGAVEALKAAKVVKMVSCNRIHVTMDYGMYGKYESLIKPKCLGTDDVEFTEKVDVKFSIPEELTNEIKILIKDLSKDKAFVRDLGPIYAPGKS